MSAVSLSVCTCCGSDIPPGREGRHDIGGGAYCLVCERVHLSGDLEVAVASLAVVEAAVKAALNGYASPQDVAAAVGRAISEMETVPADTLEGIACELRVNTERIGPERGYIEREGA